MATRLHVITGIMSNFAVRINFFPEFVRSYIKNNDLVKITLIPDSFHIRLVSLWVYYNSLFTLSGIGRCILYHVVGLNLKKILQIKNFLLNFCFDGWV